MKLVCYHCGDDFTVEPTFSNVKSVLNDEITEQSFCSQGCVRQQIELDTIFSHVDVLVAIRAIEDELSDYRHRDNHALVCALKILKIIRDRYPQDRYPQVRGTVVKKAIAAVYL